MVQAGSIFTCPLAYLLCSGLGQQTVIWITVVLFTLSWLFVHTDQPSVFRGAPHLCLSTGHPGPGVWARGRGGAPLVPEACAGPAQAPVNPRYTPPHWPGTLDRGSIHLVASL